MRTSRSVVIESVDSFSCEKWEAGSWGWGQFRKPEEWEHPLLEVTTKQWLVKTEKTLMCAVITVIFGVCNSVSLLYLFVLMSCVRVQYIQLPIPTLSIATYHMETLNWLNHNWTTTGPHYRALTQTTEKCLLITACSFVGGETCPKSCSLATTVYTAVTWQWV
jgi:hypothetical protein